MSKLICRICLRTDVKIRDIDEMLVAFHEELNEYETFASTSSKYCTYCEYLLIKCYRFKQRCIQAHKILKNYKRNSKGYPNDLHQMLPPTSLGLSTSNKSAVFNLQDGVLQPLCQLLRKKNSEAGPLIIDNTLHNVVMLKEELNDLLLFKQVDLSSESENNLQKDYSLQNVGSTSDNKKTLPVMINIDFLNENTTYDLYSTTCDIKEIDEQYLEDLDLISKNDSQSSFSASSSETKMKPKLEIKSENSLCKSEEKGKARGALRNRNELEKVFEILNFKTDEEAKEELEQRKTSEPYLSAPHKCDICYTVYRSVKLLEFHRRWHDPSAGDHVCDVCNMKFKSRRVVMDHKTKAHNARYKCKLCPVITYYTSSMEAHYKKHNGVIFTCKKCHKSFNHNSSYMQHLRIVHKSESEHICVTCARSFVSEKGLLFHRVRMHQTKSKTDSTASARCEPCGLTFVNEQVYTIHLKNTDLHKDEASSIIACNICGIKFECGGDVKVHKRSQHPNNNYKSRKSAKLVNLPIAIVKKKTQQARRELKCTMCGFLGPCRLAMRVHVAAEHPDSPYMADLARRRQHMCDTCGKCYASKYHLRDHITIHTGLKPYMCSACPARFPSKNKLLLHAQRHGPPRYECTLCGKKFSSNANLYNHKRTHIQDRRYKCSLCHKGFLFTGSLREHVRGVHNQERRVRKPQEPTDERSQRNFK